MGTNRSLNKLEFKAHMSIHNQVAVPEEETHEASFTRDRFNKKHRISDGDGNLRIRRSKKNLIYLLFFSMTPFLLAHGAVFAGSSRNTNVRVESAGLDEQTLDAKLNAKTNDSSDERPVFYADESTVVDFNENGNPNMRMKF